ncbi:hypothetical protein C0995_004061 [Termitomyces sp. Mi166|nr:hypothetical protein C0995_004061 [Termitomyces sp. Mi166\
MQGVDIAPESFIDPKMEGIFTTAASRVVAHEYSQEKIKDLEMMIRYYKERSNALTVTCRIPTEVLGAIFQEVIDRDELNMLGPESPRKKPNLRWIRSICISHICTHWRRAALSNPTLWSDIPIANTFWAKEMIKRSKMSPLTIKYSGTLCSVRQSQPNASDCYNVLKDILSSHVSHIGILILDITLSFIGDPSYNYIKEKQENDERMMELFRPLRQPAPMMTYLQVCLYPEAKAEIPNTITMGLSPLQHLKLMDCNMSWEMAALEHLKSLSLSHLSMGTHPSLLTLLSQTPLLESLEVEVEMHEPLQPPPSMTPIHLKQLEHIEISMSLRNCAVLLDHLNFARRPRAIKLRLIDSKLGFRKLDNSLAISLMRGLAEKFESGVEGSVLKLKVGDEIQCWKSTPDSRMPELANKPTIEVSFSDAYSNNIKDAFWQSLCLDQLSSLDVEGRLESDSWLSFCDLSYLRSLRVYGNEYETLSLLERGIAAMPDVPNLRPSFVRLRTLTFAEWYLHTNFGNINKKTVAQQMISCFRLRKQAGLQLDLLRLQDCGDADTEVMDRLKDYIHEVIVDNSGSLRDGETDSDGESETEPSEIVSDY